MPAAHESLAEPLDLEDARYTLHDPREIARVLQALIDSRALISAHIMPGGLPCPTALLEVGADGNILIDGSQQETINQRIAGAHHLTCISQLDRVRIQFRLAGLVRVEVEGRAAFSTPAPESLLKLQRRELYRLSLIPGPPVTLQVPPLEEDAPPLQLRVLDLSGGGLALSIRDEDEHRFPARAVLEGCLLQLPDAEPIPVQVQVAHLSRREPPLAGATLRAGCRFLALPGPAEKHILQYIFRVERQRNARERRAV
ncbi:pilus assembly protein PilZ [Pseudoxanthomonas broegbernensis]|uniref:Flagellar brake protein YcgR n=1 Tax=Pseudoxanthomonas broegbernensis TaxID=83619 RepID=A0A7V8GJV1_9GAMM|nr:flagellar brake protein [Pseudoxanthomonas broegbernensis]KAF1684564.1 pilus assembly protein PilZ [Pseudoxanthomonas broegbernensis]MBB6066485.1 c-di-GMP-binding flagellar brake protein YcgR [Pseudoxanthomonas broegbernensis]